LFAKNGVFRQGMFDLRVWPGEADGNYPSSTPGKGKDLNKNQMQRLAREIQSMYQQSSLPKKNRNGDWLDRLTFREIEMINEKEKRESDNLYLMIEFPTVSCNDKPVSILAAL
jgi:phosphatidylinositol 3-kinase